MPFLLVLLDVANSSSTGAGSLNMQIFWIIEMLIQVILVWLVFPLSIVYYESDEGFEVVLFLFCELFR